MLASRPAVAVVAAALSHHVGLRFDQGGAARLERSLSRLARQRAVTPDALAAGLAADPGALDELIDELTVQETSFFRHPAQFEALAQHILPGLAEPVTVWSAGCANGQEPYSVAMLLAELGVTEWQVVATDVSRPALERTERGFYDQRELRGLDATRLARHGRAVEGGWEVRPELLERVTTLRHRVAHDPLPVPAGRCQVVLCRNVLIYLSPPDAQRFLDSARKALVPGGWLVLGGAEALVHHIDGMTTERAGDMFAYRKAHLSA
jgi:chemotaxis protein methyltransferase CheR